MPKGKRQYGRPSAGGIKRNDYHRRNRKRHISTHSHSHGVMSGETPLKQIANLVIDVPHYDREELIALAKTDFSKRKHYNERDTLRDGPECLCVTYLRHRCTPYDALIGRRGGSDYRLLVAKRVLEAIAQAYPWLANEARGQYAERSGGSFEVGNGIRLVPRALRIARRYMAGHLTSEHVIEFNKQQQPETPPTFTDDEEISAFFQSLNSLDQTRFLYLPPFLKPEQIRERRFGSSANDRWWEWEEELGLESKVGKPNPANAQY